MKRTHTITLLAMALSGATLLPRPSHAQGPSGAVAEDRAQDAAQEPGFIMEALPPHLEAPFLPGEPESPAGDAEAPTGGEQRSRAIVPDARKLWPTGHTIAISFIGGTPEVRIRVAKIATEWEEHANLTLDFGESGGDCRVFQPGDRSPVRISFAYPGYWSLIGTDCFQARPNEPTMNLQHFDIAPPDPEEFRRVVLHEFGHALGLGHEHQSPEVDCRYDWPAIYRYLAGPPNYWDQRKVDQNMKQQTYFENSRLLASEHDPDSIMHYSFPAQFFKDDSPCHVAQNTDLSAMDKAAIAAIYPGRRQGDRSPLAVNARRGFALDEALGLAAPGTREELEDRLKLFTDQPGVSNEVQKLKDLRRARR